MPQSDPFAQFRVSRPEPDNDPYAEFRVEEPTFRTTNERAESGRPLVRDEPSSGLRGYLGEALKSLNPVEINKSVQQAFWHPIETAKDVLSAQDKVRQDAMASFESGDYITGVGKMLDWLVPVLGPRMAESGDLLAEGETARGLGALTDVGLQIAGPKALSTAAPKLTAGIRGRTPANPAEASAVAFAGERGVPLDAGTATGSQFVKNVQKRAGSSYGGANIAETAQRAQAGALARVGDELAGQANVRQAGIPGPAVDAVKAGENVRSALETKIRGQHTTATRAYDVLRQAEADPAHATRVVTQPKIERITSDGRRAVLQEEVADSIRLAVDIKSAKDALRPMYEREMAASKITPPQGARGRAVVALDRLMKGPDSAPLSVVDEALGELKALARGADMPELRTQGQGIAAGVVQRLDKQVRDRAAAAGPDVLKALEDGRAATKTKYDLSDAMDLVTTAEPRGTFNRLTASKDAGIAKLRTLQRTAPEQVPDVARALLEDILDKPTSEGGFKFADKAQADWQRIGPQTRSVLFKPDQIKALDDFFLLAKKIGENPNPSGTAQVLNATNVVAAIPMWALAKVLYSPAAVRRLTTGVRMSVSGAPAAKTAAAAQIAHALREAGVSMEQIAPAAQDQQASGGRRR